MQKEKEKDIDDLYRIKELTSHIIDVQSQIRAVMTYEPERVITFTSATHHSLIIHMLRDEVLHHYRSLEDFYANKLREEHGINVAKLPMKR